MTGHRAHGLILDDPVKGRDTAESETIRLRSILARLMDARKAEELAGKVRAQAEQEARDALGGEEKNVAEGREPSMNKPADPWRPSPFGVYVKQW